MSADPRGGSLPAGLDPAHDVVLVSSLDPRHLPASAVQVLPADERIRMHAGIDARVAQRRVAARVLLRCAVSSLDGREPQEVRVQRHCPHCPAGHGRPELPGSPLRVSVSHSGDRVVVAVRAGGAVGVDVEAPRRRPLSAALLRRALTDGELEDLLDLPEDRRRDEFLRVWTAKEAILKATGEGMHGGLRRLELDLLSRPAQLRSWAGSTARAGTVRLVELELGGGHVATLATLDPQALSVSHQEGRELLRRMTG